MKAIQSTDKVLLHHHIDGHSALEDINSTHDMSTTRIAGALDQNHKGVIDRKAQLATRNAHVGGLEDDVDVTIRGWDKKKGLPRTKALLVASGGAGRGKRVNRESMGRES